MSSLTLHEACERGDAARVKSVVSDATQRTAAVCAAQLESGATPLFVAARAQRSECVRLLLEHAADVAGVNLCDGHQRSPLHMALSGITAADSDSDNELGDSAARLLIAHAAVDVTLRDAFGVSALHLAAKALRVELAAALLSRCSAPTFVNGATTSGQTPLHWLVQQLLDVPALQSSTAAAALLQLLLAAGANPHVADNGGVTPAHLLASAPGLLPLKTLLDDHQAQTAAASATTNSSNSNSNAIPTASLAVKSKAAPGKKLQIKLKQK